MKNEILQKVSFTKKQYQKKAAKNGWVSFNRFVDEVIRITKENNGTIEDAVFIADDAYNKIY